MIISSIKNSPSFSFSKKFDYSNEYISPKLEKVFVIDNYYGLKSPGVGSYNPELHLLSISTPNITIPKDSRFKLNKNSNMYIEIGLC